jgi:hypothetical protein
MKPEVTKENKTFTMEVMETLVKEETDRVTQNVCTSCIQQDPRAGLDDVE